MREEAESLRQQMAEAVADKEQVEYNIMLDSVSKERDELVKLNNALTTELDRLKETTPAPQLPDLEAVRERILSGLKLGKQAPGYKAALKALERFTDELRAHSPGGGRLS